MSPEEGGPHGDVGEAGEPPGDPQRLRLAGKVQPVAGLDLHRGDPSAVSRFSRVSDCAVRSSSGAARSARTEETMPPPAAAISW